MKGQTQKIQYGSAFETIAIGGKPTGHSVFAIAGAGTGPYIDAVSHPLIETGLHTKPKELENALRAQLITFYEKHVIPFASYPDSERPDFDLLLARGNTSTGDRIWQTHKNTLAEVSPCAAVGGGKFYADNLLQRLYEYRPVEFATFLAAFVIFQVKENVEGCGKTTSILVIEEGKAYRIAWESLLKLEIEFRRYPWLESDVFNCLAEPDPDAAKKLWDRATKRFVDLHSRLSAIKLESDGMV